MPNATAALPDTGPGLSELFSSVGALLLILGTLFAVYWIIKRFGPASIGGARGAGTDTPALAGKLMLGQKQFLAVVRYQGQKLLLGVTEQRITLLERFDAKGEPAGPEPAQEDEA